MLDEARQGAPVVWNEHSPGDRIVDAHPAETVATIGGETKDPLATQQAIQPFHERVRVCGSNAGQ